MGAVLRRRLVRPARCAIADDDLITDYLRRLRAAMRWHPSVDDVIDETEDHLRSALAAQSGRPPATQVDVLDRFGTPESVARSFALTSWGGIAMPTRFTRTAGSVAYVAAGAWLLSVPAAMVRGAEPFSDPQMRAYFAWSTLVAIGAISTTIVVWGLLRRCGGARGPLAIVAMTLAVLGTIAVSLFTWGWQFGVGVLALASLLVVLRVHAARLGSGVADWLLVVAWPVAIAIDVVFEWAEIGPIDEYGNSVVGDVLGFGVGAVLFAAGLAVTGRWLRAEVPIEEDAGLAVA